ncbi:phage major capsid protein [Clostridium sp. 19966]|uniref:phage major capsid protein n=1 Tax=Clostridium sp. 19966 TaxID=2768166 RepID=UPI0028DF1EEF|nr:phage major capsid protein [Clostridium sp. 19966]MDT8717609.1 phage major capsid protein [Clostridium sp. 19966]
MSKELRELLNKFDGLQNEANTLMNKEGATAEEIKAKTEELKAIKAKIEAQKVLDDGKNFNENGIEITDQSKDNLSKVDNKEVSALHVKAFAKAIAKRQLNGEEIKALSSNTDADGGYLIPKDILTKINELSREYVSLRELVTVIPVNTKEGSRIIEKNASNAPFEDVEELADLPDLKSPQWAKIDYKIRDLGGLLPIPNSLLDDETGGLVDYLAQWFVKKAYATDNDMLLNADGTKGSQGILGTAKETVADNENVFTKEVLTSVVTFNKLKTVLNKSFPRPIAAAAKIVTNQSGLDILDGMEDSTGRPLLTGDGTQEFPYKFKGKTVIVYDDDTLPNDNTDVANPLVPFIIGDLKQGIVLWDRQQMSVASSKEAGFKNNSTIMRGIIRQDSRVWDKKAVRILYSKVG